MRVLLVSHYTKPHVGGIEVVAWQQARTLAQRGHDVTLLSTALPGPRGIGEGDGFRVLRVRSANPTERHGVPLPWPDPNDLRKAARALGPIDIVHGHDLLYPTTWAAARIAAVCDVPFVLHQHVAVVAHSSPVVEAVQRVVYSGPGTVLARRANAIFHLNSRVAEFVAGLGVAAERLRFLPNGVDQGLYHPVTNQGERAEIRRRFELPLDSALALFVGRPVPKKGYPLITASTDPAYTLVTVGGVSSRAVPGLIELGRRTPNEVADLLRASDFFVLPSEAEGFPLSVQEAMASGLPVVTTADHGYDCYDLGEQRIRFIERSAPAVKAALRELAADPVKRHELGANAADYAATRFSWDEHARVLEDTYREVSR